MDAAVFRAWIVAAAEVIEANREELLEYGVLPSVRAEVTTSHGAKF